MAEDDWENWLDKDVENVEIVKKQEAEFKDESTVATKIKEEEEKKVVEKAQPSKKKKKPNYEENFVKNNPGYNPTFEMPESKKLSGLESEMKSKVTDLKNVQSLFGDLSVDHKKKLIIGDKKLENEEDFIGFAKMIGKYALIKQKGKFLMQRIVNFL